jgi:Flp pilus assembly protein TadG
MTFASALGRCIGRFARDSGGASAVEFAIVSGPFLFVLLAVLQMGIYYMTQSSLDTGVIRTADALRSSFTSTSATLPPATTLKSNVATYGGGMVQNNSSLAVEIRPLTSLSAANVPITDGTANYGTTTSTLVLRAQTSVLSFAPGFGSLAVARSAALVRRQGS